jgi:hypothetical protein
MAVRPEHLQRRLGYARHAQREVDRAADALESVIDTFLREHAGELVGPRTLRFPIAGGTRRDVLDEVVQRYRGVRWNVEIVTAEGGAYLAFRLPA